MQNTVPRENIFQIWWKNRLQKTDKKPKEPKQNRENLLSIDLYKNKGQNNFLQHKEHDTKQNLLL